MYKWWCHTGTVPSQCVSIHIRGLHRLLHMYFLLLLLLLPKYRLISLSALHECEDTKTQRWEWSHSRSHCTNYHVKSHSSVAVRNSRGKCGPARYVALPSWHCLSNPFWDHLILLPSVTNRRNRGWSKLTSGATDTEVLAKGETWDVTGWRYPRLLWRYYKLRHMHIVAILPDLGVTCKEKNWWESKGEKNSYSSGALTEGIRMWGHLGWPWNKKPETSFHPFVLHFPLCGSCSPLSSPSPSLPGDSGRRGQGE